MWWLLAPNPFVILADSAPQVPPRITETGDVVRIEDYDPLSAIGRVVRDVRRSPNEDSYEEPLDPRLAVWPYGVGFQLLLGAGAVAVTAARLRAPVASGCPGASVSPEPDAAVTR